MRKAAIENAEYLAKLANEETGYGSVAAKIQKNLLVARRTPGIEDLTTYCKTGDNGMMLIEQAPFGVIGSITPPPLHQPHQHRYQQLHQHDHGRQCRGVQSPSRCQARLPGSHADSGGSHRQGGRA